MAGDRLLTLPTEILLHILSYLKTTELLPVLPTCKSVLSTSLRLLHSRLLYASNLGGYTLYLECYHPSASLTAEGFFCTRIGGDEILRDTSESITKLRALRSSYTRFLPRRTEPPPQFRVPGDVPGSRTFDRRQAAQDDKVAQTVTIDASDLFTQLTTRAYLGKREPRRGLLVTIHQLLEGTVRVWRDWLSKQCESRSFPDGSTILLQQQEDAVDESAGPVDTDPCILWVNKGDNCLGVRLKVKSRSRQSTLPIIYTSDVDLPVSYRVEFEEVCLRTSHLLLKLEEAQEQSVNGSDRAVVFGTVSPAS